MHTPLESIRRFALPLLLSAVAISALAGAAAAQELATAGDEPQQQIDAQQLLEQGETALTDNDFETALDAYHQLVVAFKNSPQAAPFLPLVYTGRGRAFIGLDDVEAGLADLNSAVQENPEYMPALLARGQLYLEENVPSAAVGDFQAVVEQDRRNMAALFGLGKSMVLLRGFQPAIKPLTYVLDQDQQNAEAYRLRAQAYAGVGKFEEAHADIGQSMSLDSDVYETHFALGTIYLAEERHTEAAQSFNDSIQRYVPKDPESDEPFSQGYLTRAATLVELGKLAEDDAEKQQAYQDALADCDTLLEKLGDSPLYVSARAATEFRRGVVLRMMGRLGDAINSLTEAINISPDLSEALFRRGICFYYIGEEKLAILDFQQAANIAYNDPRIRLWEGFTFARLGDYYEAVRAYGQAIAESDRYVPAFVNRGLAYLTIEDFEKAIADFNEAIRLEPTVAGHYFKRGVAYERLGDYEKAANSFTNAARFDETYVAAYRHSATVLAAMGHDELASQYRDAAAELEAAQQAQP